MITLGLRLQQLLAPDLALGKELAPRRLLLVWQAGRHRPARHEDNRQPRIAQRTDQKPWHDLVANAEQQSRIERRM